jgi:hypothetical protein
LSTNDVAGKLGALRIASGRARVEGIAPGEVATEAESNEIMAIRQLLKQIDVTTSLI